MHHIFMNSNKVDVLIRSARAGSNTNLQLLFPVSGFSPPGIFPLQQITHKIAKVSARHSHRNCPAKAAVSARQKPPYLPVTSRKFKSCRNSDSPL